MKPLKGFRLLPEQRQLGGDVLHHGNSQLDFGDALLAKGLAPTSSLTILENARS
jgi:hypothetical protein